MISQPLAQQTVEVSQASTNRGSILVAAQKIRKRFGAFQVLDGVDLELRSGEVVLLRGENGSGKTTLLNVLTGNLEPDSGTLTIAAGDAPECFRFPRPIWRQLNPADHFTPEKVALGMVGRAWQDLRLFRNLTILQNLLVASMRQSGENPFNAIFRPSRMRASEARAQRHANSVLASLGIQDLAGSQADATSLGQAKRAVIGRALQAESRVLFLDEPLSGLDKAGCAQILELLRELIQSHNLTLVIVEHSWHIPRLLPLATKVWTMTDGRLISELPSQIQHQLEPGGMMENLRRALQGRAVTYATLPGEADLTLFSKSRCSDSSPLLEIEDWSVKRGSRPVMGGSGASFSLKLHSGDVAVLRAPNGWGKTSLAESLLGFIPSSSGTLKLKGREAKDWKPWKRALLGLTFVQARDPIFPTLHVNEILRLSRVKGMGGIEGRLLERRADQLSGGERQRVVLTCALENNENYAVILDEPFNMLDQPSVTDFLNRLARFQGAVLVLVPMTHELPANDDKL